VRIDACESTWPLVMQRCLAALLVAASAACTVGPEPRRPDVAAPDGWSPAAERAFDDGLPSRAVAGAYDGRRWWMGFGDPTLDRLVETAAAQNLDLQQTALRIAAARAQRDAAAGARLPNVEGSGLAGRSRMSENGIAKALSGGSSGSTASNGGGGASGSGAAASSGPPSTFNLFQAGFDATWELDLFGKVRRNVQAAEADLRSAEEARRDARVSLMAEVARSYFSLRGSERQRDIAWADVATEERLLELVASRQRSGLVGEADTAAQQAQLASARAQLPPLEQAIAQSMNRIALLLALPPGGVGDWLSTATDLRLPPAVPIGLPGDLLRRRPDIRQREADLEAATARIGVAKAALFPSIRLGLAGGLQSTEAADLLSWSSRFLLGGAQLSIPVFEGGRLQAQVRVADVQAQEAVLAYRQTVLSAFHEVDNALIAYAGEQRRSVALQRQLDEARHSEGLAEARYRSGLAAYTEVLDAQRQSHQSDLSLAQSTVSASTNLVALFKALGGGWNEAEDAAP
jgi:multidrug efflux system outer membrane protein